MRESAVTMAQFDDTWNRLPPSKRFFAEETDKAKNGYRVLELGDLLVWVDQYLPNDSRNEEVEQALVEATRG